MTAAIIDHPAITWRPLPTVRPQIQPIQLIAHTAVSGANSLFDYFNGPSKGNDSHVYLRHGGTGEQYRALDTQANANGKVNHWYEPSRGAYVGAISVETWDAGEPLTTPWDAGQLDTLADIAVYLNVHYAVPLELCATPTSPGLGWHSMWPAPNPWSPGGHSCPGALRIAQFTDQLLPLIHRKAMQPIMAINPTVTDVESYVANSFKAVANPDLRGQRYWVYQTCVAVDPWAQLAEMDRQLGLKTK